MKIFTQKKKQNNDNNSKNNLSLSLLALYFRPDRSLPYITFPVWSLSFSHRPIKKIDINHSLIILRPPTDMREKHPTKAAARCNGGKLFFMERWIAVVAFNNVQVETNHYLFLWCKKQRRTHSRGRESERKYKLLTQVEKHQKCLSGFDVWKGAVNQKNWPSCFARKQNFETPSLRCLEQYCCLQFMRIFVLGISNKWDGTPYQ